MSPRYGLRHTAEVSCLFFAVCLRVFSGKKVISKAVQDLYIITAICDEWIVYGLCLNGFSRMCCKLLEYGQEHLQSIDWPQEPMGPSGGAGVYQPMQAPPMSQVDMEADHLISWEPKVPPPKATPPNK